MQIKTTMMKENKVIKINLNREVKIVLLNKDGYLYLHNTTIFKTIISVIN